MVLYSLAGQFSALAARLLTAASSQILAEGLTMFSVLVSQAWSTLFRPATKLTIGKHTEISPRNLMIVGHPLSVGPFWILLGFLVLPWPFLGSGGLQK